MPQMINVEELAPASERDKAKAAVKAVPPNLRHVIMPWYAVPPDEPGKYLGLRCMNCNTLLAPGTTHWEGCAVKWHPCPPEGE